MDQIDIVRSSDWLAVYTNGIKRIESHPWSVPDVQWIRLGMEFPNAAIKVNHSNDEWVEENGFPEKLEDVVFEGEA